MRKKSLKNIPLIRFKGFSNEWEQRQLGELGETYTGLTGKSKEDFGHGEGKYVTYLNVFMNSISDPLMTAPVENDVSQNKVQFGDVFFTTSSETPEDVGMSSVWLENSDNIYLNSFCFGFRPTEKLDSYFLAYLLRSITTRKKINYLAQGISRYNISKNKVMEIVVDKPNVDEQEKIGYFFYKFENLINLHRRRLNCFRIIKKMMLNKLLINNEVKTPELRFKAFLKDWEMVKLKDIADKVIEKNVMVQHTETFTNSAEFGLISQRDYFDHSISNTDNLCTYYVVKNDDFVYNPRISSFAPVGPINRNKLGRSGVMSPLYTVFRTHDIDNNFLEQYFKSEKWHSFMYMNGDTGARSDRFSIRDSVFIEMKIPYPDLQEQHKIGDYLNRIDALINLHQQKIENLKSLKQLLSNHMFI